MNEMNMQTSGQIETNKILVVGHHLSGYDSVVELLYSSGMSVAKPLKKEGINATDISSTLLKAHHDNSDYFLLAHEINQLSVSPVWNGLALDLMLSNIDQPFWGWADSNAISLLDYWKSLDSQIAFILIYDTPENLIKKILTERESITSDILELALDQWSAYNKEVLKFYLRNPERSLLVNTQQVQANNAVYLQQVSSQIGIKEFKIDELELVNKENQSISKDSSKDSLYSYLSKEILQQYPQVSNLYEELQSVANSPLDQERNYTVSATDALLSAVKVQNEYELKLTKEIDKSYDLNKKIEEKKLQHEELVQENELQLEQMLQVQEELERYYLENIDLKRKVSAIPKVEPKPYGAAERIKKQLSYRLGALMIENSRSFGGWITMPFALSREVKQFRKEAKSKGKKKLPPIEHYADAYEAKRVKQHLSYRLGNAMIECTGTPLGWLKLPWALQRANKDYRQSRLNVEK